MIGELLAMDRALQSTWNRYQEFLEDPELAPAQAAEFLDRLAAEPDEYLGYCTRFLHMRTMWLLRLERHEEAADTWIKGRIHGVGRNGGWDPKLRDQLEASPVVREADARYFRQWPEPYHKHQRVSLWPLTWLERCPLPVKRVWDVFDPESKRKTLLKGDDVYLFRSYYEVSDEEMAASPDIIFVAVTMPDGTIVAHSKRFRLGEILQLEGQELDEKRMRDLDPGSAAQWGIMKMEGQRVFVVYRYFTPGLKDIPKGFPMPIIFLGLDVSPFEITRSQNRDYVAMLAAATLLAGLLCLLALYYAQRARESRRRQYKAEGEVHRLEEEVRRKEKLAAVGYETDSGQDDFLVWNGAEHEKFYDMVGLVRDGDRCRILKRCYMAGEKIVRGYVQRDAGEQGSSRE